MDATSLTAAAASSLPHADSVTLDAADGEAVVCINALTLACASPELGQAAIDDPGEDEAR